MGDLDYSYILKQANCKHQIYQSIREVPQMGCVNARLLTEFSEDVSQEYRTMDKPKKN